MQRTTNLLVEKWKPLLDAEEAGPIKDNYRKRVTAQILENQERAVNEEAAATRGFLTETPHANSVTAGGVDNWNPILISLVRRAMPNLMAFDVAGVQPMTGPTGLIFAMKSRYSAMNGVEALFNEADTDFSGVGVHSGDPASVVSADSQDVGAGSLLGGGTGDGVADDFSYGEAMPTPRAENLGDVANGGAAFGEMAFSIEQATVTAKSRALKAEYTMELAQDLKAIHGLDAEAELSNILSAEVLAEINRELIRTLNVKAKLGAQTSNITRKGLFDLSTDADGRWSAEKFKGLLLQLDREANFIAKDTRRGKGNFIICSSDIASALSMTGALDYAPALKTDLNVDDTGNTFAGTLNGRIKVYIDPYAQSNYINVGYRGANPYDAGMFYCPYVPLTMVRAIDQNTFQPKIGFKTRYGMVANPYAEASPVDTTGANRSNVYFRIFAVKGILDSAS
jgi:hypothetical protein